jgi:hypothetical protein
VASSISSLRQARARHMHTPHMMERTVARCIETNETTTAHSSPIPSRAAFAAAACVRAVNFVLKYIKITKIYCITRGRIPRGPGAPPARTTKGLRAEIYFAKKLILILCGGCETLVRRRHRFQYLRANCINYIYY